MNYRQLTTLRLVICAACIGVCSTVGAQVISLSEIIRPEARSEAITASERSDDVGIDEPGAGQPDVLPQPMFFPLRAVTALTDETSSVLMRGPSARQEFRWFLPAYEVPKTLTLAMESSIYVLPERSELRVVLNGTQILSAPADAISGKKTVIIPLPEGVARPGQNEVVVSLRHTHRISCTEETAFEIWSRLYPQESGVMGRVPFASPTPADVLARLAAQDRVSLMTRGSVDLRAAGPQTALSMVGRFLQGDPVSFAPSNASGTEASVRLVFDSSVDAGSIRSSEEGSVELVLRPEDAVTDLESLLSIDASTAPAMVSVTPGDDIRLSAIGFSSAQISARQWETVLDFRLPEEWMVASTAKAVLSIDYAHIGGLPKDARIQMEVNGRPVWRLPLDFREARIRRGVPIYIPARYLSAGRNQLRFVSLIPSETPQEACAPDQDALLFEISGDSMLSIPQSPRMHLPTLSRALERVGPEDVKIASDAAAPFLTPTVALYPTRQVSDSKASSGLSLALADRNASSGAMGFNEVLRTALLATPQEAEVPDPERGVQTSQFSFSIGAEGTEDSNVSSIGAMLRVPSFRGLENIALRAGSYLSGDPTRELSAWLSTKDPQAALFLPKDDSGPVLMAAPDASPRQVAVALARAMSDVAPLHGQVAVLDQAGAWHVWNDPTTEPVLNEPITLGNFRAILSNYSLTYPHYFLAVLLGFAILMAAILTLIIHSLSRARGER